MQRLSSGLLAGAFGLLVVGLGGWWFTLALGVIVHLGLLEFFRMAQFTGIRPATKTTLVACQLLLISTQWGVVGGLPSHLAAAIFPLSGAAICGWLLPSHWLRLRNLKAPDLAPALHQPPVWCSGWITAGMVITLMACLMIVASDIGSYLIGRRFGRIPLSPISPGKTVEGAFGGLIAAVLVGVAFSHLLAWPSAPWLGGVLGALVALFALVGDLTESMMKRDAGLKDSGDALPGHGGILDRIDSYLFTPAVVFYSVTLVLPLMS
jgi:phosphatidate cytidylyltransferase